ncbi:hypothetical protein THF1C08_50044 [Vibrio jasicida]|uniref:Uncharacterized protein n=1 Tax=Vibrio jasicida TaxID=766224 RepID=A0AAU9QXT7_9VIBR|nr:hypothetical protein THF1C08_50044 [Vibrio jasicida]CAH1601891.1 hypothetical protein THF1A12_50305 [Vibrio jasicida]
MISQMYLPSNLNPILNYSRDQLLLVCPSLVSLNYQLRSI